MKTLLRHLSCAFSSHSLVITWLRFIEAVLNFLTKLNKTAKLMKSLKVLACLWLSRVEMKDKTRYKHCETLLLSRLGKEVLLVDYVFICKMVTTKCSSANWLEGFLALLVYGHRRRGFESFRRGEHYSLYCQMIQKDKLRVNLS